MIIRILIGVGLLLMGTITVLLSAFGLFRFRETLDLLHVGALADTMGVFFLLTGLMVLCGLNGNTAKLLLTLIILWVTSPISSHLLGKMELMTGHNIDPDQHQGEGEQIL